MVSTLPSPNPERRLAALARILKLLRETEDFDYLVTSLLKNLKEELPYEVFWFGTYERIKHQIISQGYLAPKPHRLLKSSFGLSPGDLMEQVVIQQRPLIVNDLRGEARIATWNAWAESEGIQGALIFPIRRRDVCYGLLLMGSTQWGQVVNNSDRTFISTICSAFADVLYKHEQALQTQLRKDPGIAVFSLIDQLRTIRDRDEQLVTVARSIFQFVEPDRVRVFWLDPIRFLFWERLTVQSRQAKTIKRYTADQPGLTMNASEIRGVYQVLNSQQPLVIGEAHSSHLKGVPDRFLHMLKANALMVAPIFEHEAFLGFISVESKQSRVWRETSRDYLTSVANLSGLMMPSLSAEEIRQASDADAQLLTGLVRSIQYDGDWYQTLDECAENICQKLGAQNFLVLLHDAERGGYNLVFRKIVASRKRLAPGWPSLDELDWQMLESEASAIAINDLTNDLKLLAWREQLQTLDVQSLIACNVAPGNAPEGIILLASQSPRQWTPEDIQLLRKIARQIGLILRQWQLQQQTDQQEDLYGSIQWGLKTLQQTFGSTLSCPGQLAGRRGRGSGQSSRLTAYRLRR